MQTPQTLRARAKSEASFELTASVSVLHVHVMFHIFTSTFCDERVSTENIRLNVIYITLGVYAISRILRL